jgi:c-di-AMP phosphodiesterase-like protein
MPKNAMPASIAGINNLLIYSIMLNANWIVTSITLFLAVVSAFVYYTIFYEYIDFVTISIVSTTMLFIVYTLYKNELKDKSQLLFMTEIKRMNEELKNILMRLPDGIVLINENNGQVVLYNDEFSRIF